MAATLWLRCSHFRLPDPVAGQRVCEAAFRELRDRSSFVRNWTRGRRRWRWPEGEEGGGKRARFRAIFPRSRRAVTENGCLLLPRNLLYIHALGHLIPVYRVNHITRSPLLFSFVQKRLKKFFFLISSQVFFHFFSFNRFDSCNLLTVEYF